MSDNEKDHLPEEGYQLPEDEVYGASESSPQPENVYAAEDEVSQEKPNPVGEILEKVTAMIPQTRNGRVALVVAVVAVIVLIAHFIGGRKTVLPVQTAKPAVQQPVKSVMPSQPVVQPQTNTQDLSSIDALQADSSQVSATVQGLKTQIDDMKSAMAQVQATNQQLEKALTAVTNQVKTLTIKLNQTIARFSSPKYRGAELVYHLRAILPDRAWIISNQGETLSVTIGDHIDQYGVVQSIDPVKGMITTSGGRNIYYGSNDF